MKTMKQQLGTGTNAIDVLRRAHKGRRYFAKPDYPFIPEVRKRPEYWAAHGWKVSDTGRAVRRVSP